MACEAVLCDTTVFACTLDAKIPCIPSLSPLLMLLAFAENLFPEMDSSSEAGLFCLI